MKIPSPLRHRFAMACFPDFAWRIGLAWNERNGESETEASIFDL